VWSDRKTTVVRRHENDSKPWGTRKALPRWMSPRLGQVGSRRQPSLLSHLMAFSSPATPVAPWWDLRALTGFVAGSLRR
jgi:hypothetical protein